MFADADTIAATVRGLAGEIRGRGDDDLLLVTKLTGGLWFLADLVRSLRMVEVDFVAMAAYPGPEQPPGVARLVKDLERPIAGRRVVVVEDVVDTGLSLQFLLNRMRALDPASIEVCALLDRQDKRLVDVPVAFRGFPLGDEYLVGYGLDFLGLYRNLPLLVVIDDIDALRAEPLALADELRERGVWTTASTDARGGLGASARSKRDQKGLVESDGDAC